MRDDSLAVYFIKPCIFCSDPQVSKMVFHNFPHCISADGCLAVIGKIFLKLQLVLCIIVDAAKISSGPHTAFPVFAKGVHGIVGKRIGVVVVFPEVNDVLVLLVVHKDARLGGEPIF